ncbi:hypothetical protein C2E31_16145 [Rhodopirellula baltica]|nr:hypothetical protein C2E31_16145 [Rhodopirellula baltica]
MRDRQSDGVAATPTEAYLPINAHRIIVFEPLWSTARLPCVEPLQSLFQRPRNETLLGNETYLS